MFKYLFIRIDKANNYQRTAWDDAELCNRSFYGMSDEASASVQLFYKQFECVYYST